MTMGWELRVSVGALLAADADLDDPLRLRAAGTEAGMLMLRMLGGFRGGRATHPTLDQQLHIHRAIRVSAEAVSERVIQLFQTECIAATGVRTIKKRAMLGLLLRRHKNATLRSRPMH